MIPSSTGVPNWVLHLVFRMAVLSAPLSAAVEPAA
jgi:hypothetical protein